MLASSLYDGHSRVINIGSGIGISLLELISEIELTTQKKAKINFFPARKFDVMKNVLKIDLASSELNWQPKVSLRKGLERTMHWLQKQN
jgi:UDP-glucose 4-epimerase